MPVWKMAIRPSEQLAFRLISIAYFYMWPLPMKWNHRKCQLEITKPLVKLSPCLLLLLVTWIYGCVAGSWSFGIYFGVLTSPEKFRRHNMGLLFFAGAAMCVISVVQWYIIRFRKALISVIDSLLYLADKCDQEYSTSRERWYGTRKFGLQGILLAFVIVPSLATIPLIVTVVSLYSNIDVSYYVLEEFLSDPKYRNASQIYFAILFRICINFICTAESCRICAYPIVCIFIIYGRFSVICKLILSSKCNVDGFHRYFSYLVLLFKKIEIFANLIIYLFMTVMFWALIFFCWACVRCDSKKISLPTYTLIVMMTCVLLLLHYIILPPIVVFNERMVLMVKVNWLRAKFLYARKRTKLIRTHLIRAKATAPIRLKYGPFCYIGANFAPEYIFLIISRIFDSIVIFEFR